VVPVRDYRATGGMDTREVGEKMKSFLRFPIRLFWLAVFLVVLLLVEIEELLREKEDKKKV
jgi:hypothetical protein